MQQKLKLVPRPIIDMMKYKLKRSNWTIKDKIEWSANYFIWFFIDKDKNNECNIDFWHSVYLDLEYHAEQFNKKNPNP